MILTFIANQCQPFSARGNQPGLADDKVNVDRLCRLVSSSFTLLQGQLYLELVRLLLAKVYTFVK